MAREPFGALDELPARFVGTGSNRLDARFRVAAGDVCRDVVIAGGTCTVEPADGVVPDVEITTDAATWRAIDGGRLSGIEAFCQRKLTVRGSIEKSLWFEPLFRRPAAGGLRYTLERVSIGRPTISALFAGDENAEPLVLIHGLGATKASWLTVIPQLAQRYRVIALDLPGYGASSKPYGPYSAAWLATHVFSFLDVLGYDRALVAGNSMGGRIAMEMAMTAPERVDAIACLCPATAFSDRPLLWLARLARAELGVVVTRLPRDRILEALRGLFADPSRIEDSWYEAAVDDFLHVWRRPRARMAFFASLRNIYLDEPDGDLGFWARLALVKTPSLFVYGEKDSLISHYFGKKVTKTLPGARVEVWPDSGHAPQLEHPDRTADALLKHFAHSAAARRAS